MESKKIEFIEDLQSLLTDYLTAEDLNTLNSRIGLRGLSGYAELFSLSETDRDQLKAQFTPAIERYQIDRTITHAGKKLSSEKYYELLVNLSELCISHGKLNLAQEIVNKTTRESEDDDVIAKSYLVLSDFHSRKANWQESIDTAEKAGSMFEKINDKTGVAKSENILGAIYGEKGEIDKAKLHFERSLDTLDGEKDKELAAMLEINLGIINNIYENFEKALEYFNSSLKKFEEIGDKRRIAEIKYNIGMLQRDQKNFHSALKEFDEAIRISNEAGYKPILGLSYLSKANILMEIKEYSLAS
ncbi:tetratricopeptide repeat protein, partial [Bacteroidota bacterium]